VTRAEADAMEGRFNGGRFATIGLMAAGGLLAGTGVVITLVDTQLSFTPGGVLLSGKW
jgi:hypothetical protein